MLSIDANLIVVFLFVWVLVFALTKLFFNPVRRIQRQRELRLQADQKAFGQASESCEKSLQEIETALKSAKSDSDIRRATIKAEALKEKSQMLAEIHAEYKSQVLRARAEIDHKVRELEKELESEAGGLAQRIEQRLLN